MCVYIDAPRGLLAEHRGIVCLCTSLSLHVPLATSLAQSLRYSAQATARLRASSGKIALSALVVLRSRPCSHIDAPLHSLHWRRRRPCSHIDAPPHSLHRWGWRPCSHFLGPLSHSLHWLRRRPCSHTGAPPHSLHLLFSFPCWHIYRQGFEPTRRRLTPPSSTGTSSYSRPSAGASHSAANTARPRAPPSVRSAASCLRCACRGFMTRGAGRRRWRRSRC